MGLVWRADKAAWTKSQDSDFGEPKASATKLHDSNFGDPKGSEGCEARTPSTRTRDRSMECAGRAPKGSSGCESRMTSTNHGW